MRKSCLARGLVLCASGLLAAWALVGCKEDVVSAGDADPVGTWQMVPAMGPTVTFVLSVNGGDSLYEATATMSGAPMGGPELGTWSYVPSTVTFTPDSTDWPAYTAAITGNTMTYTNRFTQSEVALTKQ